jgi:hypothetical protein
MKTQRNTELVCFYARFVEKVDGLRKTRLNKGVWSDGNPLDGFVHLYLGVPVSPGIRVFLSSRYGGRL